MGRGFVAIALWGASFVATKVALAQAAPLTVVWLRFGIGVMVLGALVAARGELRLPPARELPPRDELRRRLGLSRGTLAFAGRLTAQKALPLAVEALARVDGVDLVVVGEGPDRDPLERLEVLPDTLAGGVI